MLFFVRISTAVCLFTAIKLYDRGHIWHLPKFLAFGKLGVRLICSRPTWNICQDHVLIKTIFLKWGLLWNAARSSYLAMYKLTGALFFFFFINLRISYIHFECYSLSRFLGKHSPPPSLSLWVFPSPPSPHCRPPPNSLVHWGFSLSRTQGFPFHWCSY